MAEKFSIHRLVKAELTPRLKAGERVVLRSFAEELYDEYTDDFISEMRDVAIHRVVDIARQLLSEAVSIKQGAFDFGDLPSALAVPTGGPSSPHTFVAIEHATRVEARAALHELEDQRERLVQRVRAIETFIVTAEARGCPDDGILFDYLNGASHHTPHIDDASVQIDP